MTVFQLVKRSCFAVIQKAVLCNLNEKNLHFTVKFSSEKALQRENESIYSSIMTGQTPAAKEDQSVLQKSQKQPFKKTCGEIILVSFSLILML